MAYMVMQPVYHFECVKGEAKMKRRIASFVIVGIILCQMATANICMAFGAVKHDEAQSIIRELVCVENSHQWDKYPDLWCEEEREFYKNILFDEKFVNERNGILCVDSAELYSIEQIDNIKVESVIEDYLYSDRYRNVQSYMVGIDYRVDEVNNSFYNGINYRLIVVGEENFEIKILAVMELPEYLLDSGSEDENKEIAKNIIEARKEGYVVDSDMGIVGSDNQKYTNSGNNSVVTYGFRPGYSHTTKFDLRYPSKIRIYCEDEKEIYELGFPIYTKRVLPNEMIISSTEPEALKAQVICIQQFAAWNTIYYSKYPNQGYDLTNTTKDQKYDHYTYDSLNNIYKKKVDDAYAAVKTLCMVTRTNNALFESGYVYNKDYDKTKSIAKMYQEGAAILAARGKDFRTILRGYFDNSILYTGSGNMRIDFAACHK